MSNRYMQPLRIIIQSGFFCFIIWIGLRFYHFVESVRFGLGETLTTRPAGVEAFLPISGLVGTVSMVKNGEINAIHPAAVVLFLTIILTSFLLRRSFCSWICPVSLISECAWKNGFYFFKRNWHLPKWLDIGLRCLKYIILIFFLYISTIAMSADTISSFIVSDYHKIADIRLMNFFLHISPLALAIILLLFIVSFPLRNPFCRYLCPYGALLGVVAIFSPLRVTRNIERCVSCGVCSQVCPSHIDVMHKSSVASAECIACWRCISHCRFNSALSMRVAKRYIVQGFVFAILVVMLLWGGTMIGKLSGHWTTSLDIAEYRRLLAN